VHVTLLSPLFTLVGPLAAESKFQHRGNNSHTDQEIKNMPSVNVEGLEQTGSGHVGKHHIAASKLKYIP
jgi:hypothetical protein